MSGPRPPHRLAPNHRQWTPANVIYIDTETYATVTELGETHELRCWAARLDVRRDRNPDHTGTVTAEGQTAAEAAAQIEAWSDGVKSVWLYAHNLSFDLAVTRLPVELARRGWKLTGHGAASESPWIRMKKGSTVLTMADSWGWLRAPLGLIAQDLGVPYRPLPDRAATEDEWRQRCAADTDLLAVAMRQLLDWWDTAGLGSWTLTGSGGGWNTYRHKSPGPLPLIVPGEQRTEIDRAAIYGGRREAYRHGPLEAGPWELLDFRDAYPTVAASHNLPVQPQGTFECLDLDSPLVCGEQWGIIAQVEVETDVPRWPVKARGVTCYPVGRFITTLPGPEIAEARRLGCLLAIGPGQLHRLSDHAAPFARWILRVSSGDEAGIPPAGRRAVKHWGRAVIGKFAAHGYQVTRLKSLGGDGWLSRPAWNAALQAPSHLTEICGVAEETVLTGEGDNAYPAVYAWVESWTRVYLARAMEAAGLEHVISCDTDGFIITTGPASAAAVDCTELGMMTLRVKASYERVEIAGPQHITTDTGTKMAGIPPSVKPATDGTLEALLWPKLAWQMEHRTGTSTAAYLRPRQKFTMPENTVTGWVLPSGIVLPLLANTCQHGQPQVKPPDGVLTEADDVKRQAFHVKHLINRSSKGDQSCTCRSSRSPGKAAESTPSHRTRSSTFSRNPARRKAAKPGTWRTLGGCFATVMRLVFSGWTRTSRSTRTQPKP